MLYIIVPYFNYEGNSYRENNLYNFIDKYKNKPNTKLIVAEAVYQNQNKLKNLQDQIYKHLVFDTDQKIWLKENLVNLAVKTLPDDWECMAWIDGDIEFLNKNWVEETIDKLNYYDVLQLFEKIQHLDKDNKPFIEYFYKPYSIMNNGHQPGFAWAIHRRAYDKIEKLFEYNILGAGDYFLARSFINKYQFLPPKIIHTNYVEEYPSPSNFYFNLIDDFYKKCQKFKVYFTSGKILHFWHGSLENRMYRERWDILSRHQYDPNIHLLRKDNGLIQIKPEYILLIEDINNLFKKREVHIKEQKQKVLLIQNTDFHLETMYCLYDILKESDYDPYVLYLPEKNKTELEDFLFQKHINLLKVDINTKNLKDQFSYVFVVTGDFLIQKEVDLNTNIPMKSHPIFNIFKDKIIFICHRAFTPILHLDEYYKEFKNPKFLSVCPYSQSKGINFIYQTSNIFIKRKTEIYEPILDEVKFIFLGRFNRIHRDFYHLNLLLNNLHIVERFTKRKFKIILMGQNAHHVGFNHPPIEKKSGLSEEQYYRHLKNDCHFIFNFIKKADEPLKDNPYFKDTFSSNYTNSIVFQKPMLGEVETFLHFNIPNISYNNDESFLKSFVSAVNMNSKQYLNMVLSFDLAKENYRNHNLHTIKKLKNTI